MVEDRKRAFLPGEPPMPSRSEQRLQLELMLARAKAKQSLKQEAREKELAQVNRPPDGYQRPLDTFEIAAQKFYAEQAALDEIEHAAWVENLLLERRFRLRREAIAARKRAEKVLRDTEYLVKK
jgi:hypothetical protein